MAHELHSCLQHAEKVVFMSLSLPDLEDYMNSPAEQALALVDSSVQFVGTAISDGSFVERRK